MVGSVWPEQVAVGVVEVAKGCPAKAGWAVSRLLGGNTRETPTRRLWQPADMPELRVVQFHYALPDDAWCVELSEAVPAPEAWAEVPNAQTHLPGAAFLVAVIPDEDPDREPTVHVHSHDEHVIPYQILRWFMDHVGEQVERCRIAFEQGEPEAVE